MIRELWSAIPMQAKWAVRWVAFGFLLGQLMGTINTILACVTLFLRLRWGL
jgi:hypothetical protein